MQFIGDITQPLTYNLAINDKECATTKNDIFVYIDII